MDLRKLLTGLLFAAWATACTADNASAVCGDVNGDNRITASDALGIGAVTLGERQCDLADCDVDLDGEVTVDDVLIVLIYSIDDSQPLPCAADVGLQDSDPLVISGRSDVTIRNVRIENPDGDCIRVENSSNVRIENSVIGPCAGEGVSIRDSSRVSIFGTLFEYVRTGVYAVNSQSIDVTHNEFFNMQGPMPRGQFVQFNKVTGPGNRVNLNYGENILGDSTPEDNVSLFKSHGTSDDPIQINDNYMKGGGPSGSGGGIMTGDYGGSNVVVRGNVVIDPGQYGVAVAGGENIKLLNNKIYGKQQSFTNVGLYVWKQAADSCRNIEVRGNEINYTNKAGNKNPAWNAGNCGSVAGWDDNDRNANIGASMAPPNGAGIPGR